MTKEQRDWKNVMDTAVAEAVAATAKAERVQIALNAIGRGADDAFVAAITGLTPGEIEALRRS